MSQVAPRVGIVLVSHSVRLAEGAADLAGQVSGGAVRVLAAGGTEDGELGTSAEKIAAAVAGAETGAGVLVLPDLGSAVLTVRAMFAAPDAEEVADTPGARVVLADAPFVEGAVAATVTAAAGADLKAVATAAQEAWHARKL